MRTPSQSSFAVLDN